MRLHLNQCNKILSESREHLLKSSILVVDGSKNSCFPSANYTDHILKYVKLCRPTYQGFSKEDGISRNFFIVKTQ